jgi:glycine/D-amino acid oxidase-like deaminating enzyme
MHLAQRSFDLHAELAEELGGDWGYRRLTTYGGVVAGASTRASRGLSRGWISPDVEINRRLGSNGTTAQVHPAAFTNRMMCAAQAQGAELRLGRVTGLLHRAEEIVGVDLDGEAIEADAIVIAMGPWSALAARWLSLPPVWGLKGHSIVFETGELIPPEALFLEYDEGGGSMLSPEIFARPDGTTYVCAISTDAPLPVDPTSIVPDDGAIDRLKALCDRISPVLAGSRVRVSGACYRPVTQDGLPLIGAVAGARGAYVATGHSVWGILNAPATAEAIAELVLDGVVTTIDLAPFDPARLAPLDSADLATSQDRSGSVSIRLK